MTATLQETLCAPGTQPAVLADCQALIEQQVSGMSGISGTAVKLAYKTVHAFAPGLVTYLIAVAALPDVGAMVQKYAACRPERLPPARAARPRTLEHRTGGRACGQPRLLRVDDGSDGPD